MTTPTDYASRPAINYAEGHPYADPVSPCNGQVGAISGRDKTDLEILTGELITVLSHLNEANRRIENSLMRIKGSWPTNAPQECLSPDTDGQLPMLVTIVSQLRYAVSETEDHASRLAVI